VFALGNIGRAKNMCIYIMMPVNSVFSRSVLLLRLPKQFKAW